MKSRIKIYKEELEEILEILNKFPEPVDMVELEYNSNEIGHLLDLIVPTSIQGRLGEFKVRITDVDTW